MRLPIYKKELIIKTALKKEDSIVSLSKKYGISRKTIYSWIKLYKLASSRTKSRSLESRYISGKKHPKEYRHTLKDSLTRLVIKNPDLNITQIAQILKAGRHAIYNLLKDLNLTCSVDRLNFSKLYKHPGVLDNEIKLSIVRAVINSKESVTSLSKTHNVARKTIYEWVKRYKEEGKVEEKYISGFNHPKAYSISVRDTILNKVIESPALSIHSLSKELNLSSHGVYNVLKRYSLTYKGARIIYSQEAERKVIKPATTGVWNRVKSVFEEFLASRAPAPPPVKSIIKTFFSSLTASFVISSIFIVLIRTLSQASGTSQVIGLFFAFSALAMGSFFFLYSLKYYITLGIVLSFSQSEDYSSQNRSTKDSLVSWLMGNSRKTLSSNSNKVVGLEPNLDRVHIKKHPFISVHIPFYNEKYVVERSIQAATNFDYAGEYEVILCDDSTDQTSSIINKYQKQCLLKDEKLKIIKGDGWTLTSVEVKPGVILKHLHRTNRNGYKGAALEVARTLSNPKTEFISIFDADFVPYPDTLELFLKYFKVQNNNSEEYTKSNVAVVQGYQWHVLNKSENWVTRGVRTEYSGSYVIERSGSEIYGGLKQISGSVYMIRKDVLDEIGWGTSITEDFELTLKLYEKGYKVVYTPYIQAPAECVSTVKRLIRQRMRWSEGHSQNIKKMFGRLITSPKISFMEKIELSYLSPYYLQAFFFLLGTLSWFISETVFRVRLPFWTELWGWSLVLTNMLSLPLVNGVGMFLEESEQKDYLGLGSFVILSYILVPFQAYAALKGFMEESEGPWFRTPKTGKITDIFTRGSFYRFIQGILPGKVKQSLPVQEVSTKYLALNTANNRFNNFNVYHQRHRKPIATVFLVFLLIISMTILRLAPGISINNIPVAYASEIFNIDHETNDLTQYTTSVTDSGDLSVAAGAALNGTNYGLSALIDGTGAIYGQKTVSQVTSINYKFYLDPNTVTMSNNDTFDVAQLIQNGGSSRLLSSIQLRYLTATGYRIIPISQNDAGTNAATTVSNITDAPHLIEVNIIRAATSTSADGTHQWWVDGVSIGTNTGIDNYNNFLDVEYYLRLGAVANIDASTSGTIYLDELTANNNGGNFTMDNETGNLNRYSFTATDTGSLSVTSGAALNSSGYGLSAQINDNNVLRARKDVPASAKLRYRFYFDPNSITMADTDQFDILVFQDSAGVYMGQISFRYLSATGYRFVFAAHADGVSNVIVDGCDVSDAPHYVEVYSVRAATSSSSDGSYEWWVDGTSQGSVTGVDNYNLMSDKNFYLMQVALQVDTGTRGTVYFDDWQVNDDGSSIGAVPENLWVFLIVVPFIPFLIKSYRKKHGLIQK